MERYEPKPIPKDEWGWRYDVGGWESVDDAYEEYEKLADDYLEIGRELEMAEEFLKDHDQWSEYQEWKNRG